MTTLVSKRDARQKKWLAWVGSRDRLDRVVRVLEDLLKHKKDEILRHAEVERERAKKEAEAHPKTTKAQHDWSNWDHTIEETGWLVLSATARERNGGTLGGPPDAVLAEVDLSRLESLTLDCPGTFATEFRAEVTLDDRGCEVSVSGEFEWVQRAFPALVAELCKGVPWWSYLRHWVTGVVFVVLALSGVAYWPDSELVNDFSSAVAILVILAGVGGVWIVRWILPGVDVVGPDQRGKGARALGVIATIVVSLLVPWLTR